MKNNIMSGVLSFVLVYLYFLVDSKLIGNQQMTVDQCLVKVEKGISMASDEHLRSSLAWSKLAGDLQTEVHDLKEENKSLKNKDDKDEKTTILFIAD